MSRIISECIGGLRKKASFNHAALLQETFFPDWEIIDSPRRLIKDYSFDEHAQLKFFVSELLD